MGTLVGSISKLFAGLIALFLLASARAEAPATTEHGKLTEFQGLPVLELWGTRDEMAYAHGYLMAPRIMPLIENFMLFLPFWFLWMRLSQSRGFPASVPPSTT